MSLFGALMGEYEEDPFFGVHNRAMNQMNTMVNSFFSDPFGDVMGMAGMGFPSLMGGHPAMPAMGQLMPHVPRRQQRGRELMPFGFPMDNVFSAIDNRQNMGNCHSFSSSTMVSMTTGPDGRPQVYQASSSTRTAPGGIRETKKAVADTRSGTKKMAIGHHIGERGHVVEREHNLYSGEQEERQELINLEENSAEDFNREWENRTRRAMGGVAIEDVTDRPSAYQRGSDRPLLALPSSSSSARSRVRAAASPSASATSAASSRSYRRRSLSASVNLESSRYTRQLATRDRANATTALTEPRHAVPRSISGLGASEVSAALYKPRPRHYYK